MATATMRLQLRLPGDWAHLDPAQPELTARRLRTFAERSLGRADELATTRARLRDACTALMEGVPEDAALESTFLCREIARGIPSPLAISVFAPTAMHMSPALGTASQDVIDAFLTAMETLGEREAWRRGTCRDGHYATRWRVEETPVASGDDDARAARHDDVVIRRFVADYWRTVPGSKNLVLVSATSPLADIPQTLSRLCDAVVAGSRFVAPRAGDGPDARPGEPPGGPGAAE